MANDTINFDGNFHLYAHDADGNLIEERHCHNIFLNRGRNILTAIMGELDTPFSGTLTAKVKHLAIGSDGTAAAATQTGIIVIIAAQSATPTQTTTAVTNDTLSLQTVFSLPTGGTIREVAVTGSSNGVLFPTTSGFARSVVSPALVMPTGSAITVIYTLQIT